MRVPGEDSEVLVERCVCHESSGGKYMGTRAGLQTAKSGQAGKSRHCVSNAEITRHPASTGRPTRKLGMTGLDALRRLDYVESRALTFAL
jgi:hypothetical protein